MIKFFNGIRKTYDISLKLHVILDQSGYHRSDILKKTAKALNIKLHYLPAYSPNLNPIERLWKVMNEHIRNNKFFASAKNLEKRSMIFSKKSYQ